MGLKSAFRAQPAIALAAALAVAGCASLTPPGPQRDAALRASALPSDDPLEQQNRNVLAFNKVANDAAISPAAHVYRGLIPQAIRDRLSNGVSNLQEPRIFANNILQFRFGAAFTTLARFVFNSTFGVAGMYDVASAGGLPRQTGDFGETLYVWGVSSGPFLIAPILGPTDQRDEIGHVVDIVTDPAGYAIGLAAGPYPPIALGAEDGLDKVELLDDLEAGSIDFYGRLRSTYLQKRASELGGAVGADVVPESVAPQIAAPGTNPGPH